MAGNIASGPTQSQPAPVLDLVVRNARLAHSAPTDPDVDIGVRDGVIVAIGPRLHASGPEIDARGQLVSPGLVESHFHLDKAMIVDRVPYQPNRMVRDHMPRTASIKHTFTYEDIYARAAATLDQCLLHGVTHMRTQIEVDPIRGTGPEKRSTGSGGETRSTGSGGETRSTGSGGETRSTGSGAEMGLLGFEAIEQLRRDYAWAIDIQPCVFLQEGWTGVPGADENLVACLERGAAVIGGGIRYDKDGPGQIRRVFELARHYDIDVDFHLDGGYEIDQLDYPQICELTERLGWQGRVAFGHGSKYSCMPVRQQAEVGKRLARAGVSLAVLPATDLFNGGRHMEHSVLRGVTDAHTLIENGANCTLSTNNVLNAFTPYGDCSLTRIANLYANVVQRYGPQDLDMCFEMITSRGAQLMRLADYGIEVGKPADLVVWNETTPADVIARCALPLAGFKRGRRVFTRELPVLHPPK